MAAISEHSLLMTVVETRSIAPALLFSRSERMSRLCGTYARTVAAGAPPALAAADESEPDVCLPLQRHSVKV